ncbi:unnamed protein product [Arctia plantaginis]|uniref:Uncharacterized protein n=1 Tax=Arctia plantaginis TaxID=874455 RepID=A0A8S1BF64_ARCPL|nr:unnamed protein product [Arctia plantaginis]
MFQRLGLFAVNQRTRCGSVISVCILRACSADDGAARAARGREAADGYISAGAAARSPLNEMALISD